MNNLLGIFNELTAFLDSQIYATNKGENVTVAFHKQAAIEEEK